ncbi:DUF2079 domain-containing protein [Cyanobium sp. FGCU-6]|nr:DUF2079 domain-containing protein [Cyanobium sp. FGCU6]
MADRAAPGAAAHPGERHSLPRSVAIGALLFALAGLLLQAWRVQVLHASMDQGIFLQVMANGLRGHPFASTLSSQLSTNVIHAGELPALGYRRLGQHFTPILVIWMPLVGLLGRWALPLIQVGVMTAAGLVLFQLARERLPAGPASWITLSFYGANAVLGPTWGNFTDLCQLPLAIFVLLLGLERRSAWLLVPSALAVPLIREDTGVLLVGVGLWLAVRQPRRWPLATALALWGGGWVVLVTNVLMPLFSDDNSRRFMVENFGQYIPGEQQASSLEVLRSALTRPALLLQELVSPPRQTLTYLAAQGLPLMFVPLISLDSWLLMGLPLLGLLLAQGDNNPLSINIRYTLLVVPGLFAGTILWWQRHPQAWRSRRLRRIWALCLALSLLFTLTGNPNRSLSWLIPDSVRPWVYSTPWRQWQHGQRARSLLALIPPDASVAASTQLIPPLAAREVLVRFPDHHAYRDRSGQEKPVDWIAVDLDWLERYGVAFRRDRYFLRRSLEHLQELPRSYGVRRVDDGVVLLQREGEEDPHEEAELQRLLKRLRTIRWLEKDPD